MQGQVKGKNNRKHNNCVFVMACMLGALVFVFIYGIRILNPLYDGWLLGSDQLEGLNDLSQHYQGWLFYRRSSWHFPIGLIDGLYSEPVSIAYTDSIPLFAIIFKVLSPILPDTFQYFGIFGLICYMLMAGCGARIVSRFTDSICLPLMGGFLFSVSPVLLKRMFYHTALSAHFLVLIAIDIFIINRSLSTGRRNLYWLLLNVTALLINPYFVPMVLGIQLLSLLQGLICDWPNVSSKGALISEVILSVISSFSGLILTAWFEGLFYGNISPSAGGLDRLSFNLNQFINPNNFLVKIHNYQYDWSGQNYSNFLPGLDLVSPWQEEGFSYLGLGLILLCLLVFILALIKLVREFSSAKRNRHIDKSRIIAIVLGGLIFTFLAMSPKGTIGQGQVYNIAYPDFIVSILSVFRSTGRLIWPVYYGIVTLGFYGLCQISKKNVKLVIALIICLIQVVDLWPALSYKHQAYNRQIQYQSRLQDSRWETLAREKTRVYFYTPVHFGLYCDPELSCVFEYYAYEHNMTLNVTYFSRDLSEEADARTLEHFQAIKDGEEDDDILYVFFDCSSLPDAEEYGLDYIEMDDYTIAVSK